MTSSPWPADRARHAVIAAAIPLSAYLVIAVGRAPLLRLDRPGAALVGAGLTVVSGAIGFDDTVRAAEAPRLALLFGMMVFVAHIGGSGEAVLY